MRAAWAMVRKAQSIYSGNLRQYLAEALRLAWADLNSNPVVQEFRSIIRDIRAKKAAGTFRPGRQSAYRAAYYAASW